MSSLAIVRSSLTTSSARYLRSWGLWVLLVIALIGSRFFVSRDDGQAVVIAVHDQLPVLTSAMLGVSLGIVVSTLLLPIGFIYLRSNTTRRQPWQVEEVTPASRVAVALGRFFADVGVLAAVLAALTLAGFILALLRITPSDIRPGDIIAGLWLVAGPAVMGLAAIRILFDAVPWTRGALGEVLFFVLWMASIAMPVATGGRTVGFTPNLTDFAGFISPLTYAAPSDGKQHATPDLTIGGAAVKPGRIPLDVMAGLTAPGYPESRLAWAAIACAVAAGAGLLYRPHRPRRRSEISGKLARLLSAGPPRPANPNAPPARLSALPWLGLVAAEFRLIGGGRLFMLLALAAAASGLAADYRHVGAAVMLLLLLFRFSAQAGRTEAKGLRALTLTAAHSPMARRIAFVIAAAAWSLLLAIPAFVTHPWLAVLEQGVAPGVAAAATAAVLGAVTRSAFTPRLVLLVAWYAYLSS
jgi:hypothetical protein